MFRNTLLILTAAILMSISSSISAEIDDTSLTPKVVKYDWIQLSSYVIAQGELKSL